MKCTKAFDGVVVYPKKVMPGQRIIVGVWLGRKISTNQRQRLMDLNIDVVYARGHIGVHIDKKMGTTAVKYLAARAENQQAVRDIAVALMRAVRQVTRTGAIFLQLPNYRSVSRALAI